MYAKGMAETTKQTTEYQALSKSNEKNVNNNI